MEILLFSVAILVILIGVGVLFLNKECQHIKVYVGRVENYLEYYCPLCGENLPAEKIKDEK